jgi:hypothetical protein
VISGQSPGGLDTERDDVDVEVEEVERCLYTKARVN